MKPGEKMFFRFRGKFVPVRIVSIRGFGIECEFLADLPPVKTGEKMFCGSANLFKTEGAESK